MNITRKIYHLHWIKFFSRNITYFEKTLFRLFPPHWTCIITYFGNYYVLEKCLNCVFKKGLIMPIWNSSKTVHLAFLKAICLYSHFCAFSTSLCILKRRYYARLRIIIPLKSDLEFINILEYNSLYHLLQYMYYS